MPILGRNCGILVNGTGLATESFSLSQNSTVNQFNPLGLNASHFNVVNNGIQNQVTINYLINTSQEPIYNNLSGIKNNYSGTPLNLNIAGFTGLFYLTSYGFNLIPNKPIIANAEFINFTNITGNFTGNLVRNITGNFNQRAANGNSVSIIGTDGNKLPLYDLSYSFKIDYLTYYKIGQKEPYSVIFNKASENISLTSDDYTGISFYGSDAVSNILKGANNIAISNLSTVSGSWVLNFPISGARVNNLSQDFNFNDVAKNKYSIINLY